MAFECLKERSRATPAKHPVIYDQDGAHSVPLQRRDAGLNEEPSTASLEGSKEIGDRAFAADVDAGKLGPASFVREELLLRTDRPCSVCGDVILRRQFGVDEFIQPRRKPRG